MWNVGLNMTKDNGFQFDWQASKNRITRETPITQPVFFVSFMDDDEELENLDWQEGGGGAQAGNMLNTIPMFVYTQTPINLPDSVEIDSTVNNYGLQYQAELTGLEGLQDAIRAWNMIGPLADLMCQYIEEIHFIGSTKTIDQLENEKNKVRYKLRYEIRHSMEINR